MKNLDDGIDDERLRKEFSPYGTITSAKVRGQGWAGRRVQPLERGQDSRPVELELPADGLYLKPSVKDVSLVSNTY